jgi:hypothetical protein
MVAHDLAGDASDQCGLATVTLLVAAAEPIPALLGAGGGGLGRVGHEGDLHLGQHVHLGASRTIVGRRVQP